MTIRLKEFQIIVIMDNDPIPRHYIFISNYYIRKAEFKTILTLFTFIR